MAQTPRYSLYRKQGGNKIYADTEQGLRHITSPDVMKQAGYDFDSVVDLPEHAFQARKQRQGIGDPVRSANELTSQSGDVYEQGQEEITGTGAPQEDTTSVPTLYDTEEEDTASQQSSQTSQQKGENYEGYLGYIDGNIQTFPTERAAQQAGAAKIQKNYVRKPAGVSSQQQTQTGGVKPTGNEYKVKNDQGFYDVYDDDEKLSQEQFQNRGLNVDHLPERNNPRGNQQQQPQQGNQQQPQQDQSSYYRLEGGQDVYQEMGEGDFRPVKSPERLQELTGTESSKAAFKKANVQSISPQKAKDIGLQTGQGKNKQHTKVKNKQGFYDIYDSEGNKISQEEFQNKGLNVTQIPEKDQAPEGAEGGQSQASSLQTQLQQIRNERKKAFDQLKNIRQDTYANLKKEYGLEKIKTKIGNFDTKIKNKQDEKANLLKDERGKAIPEWMLSGRKKRIIDNKNAEIKSLRDQRNSLADDYNSIIDNINSAVERKTKDAQSVYDYYKSMEGNYLDAIETYRQEQTEALENQREANQWQKEYQLDLYEARQDAAGGGEDTTQDIETVNGKEVLFTYDSAGNVINKTVLGEADKNYQLVKDMVGDPKGVFDPDTGRVIPIDEINNQNGGQNNSSGVSSPNASNNFGLGGILSGTAAGQVVNNLQNNPQQNASTSSKSLDEAMKLSANAVTGKIQTSTGVIRTITDDTAESLVSRLKGQGFSKEEVKTRMPLLYMTTTGSDRGISEVIDGVY